jgi:hypothetical protein
MAAAGPTAAAAAAPLPWGAPSDADDVVSSPVPGGVAPLLGGRTFLTDALLKGLEASTTATTTATRTPVGVDAQSQATLLLLRRKEARLAGDELEAAAAAHAAATARLDEREAALAARARAQQATAARFRPFLEEGAAKCERAARRERADVAAAAALDADIGGARADIARAQGDWAAVEADACRLRRYADYLADVKAEADGVGGGGVSDGPAAAAGASSSSSSSSAERFDDVRDILRRWVAVWAAVGGQAAGRSGRG